MKILEHFQPFYDLVSEEYRSGLPLCLDALPNDDHLTYRVEDEAEALIRSLLPQTDEGPQATSAR